MPPHRALIIGVAGQDGSYLAEFLLAKGYAVYGMVRGAPAERYERLEHVRDELELLQGDLLDQSSLESVLKQTSPTEVYNLAAPSFVPTSWTQPALTSEFIAIGVTRLLEAMRNVNPGIRFYQASSSEMFGRAKNAPQNEETPFSPRSPYGAAKVYAHHLTTNYRERYDMFAVSGILYNHESPRRGLEFVTRKVTDGVAQIKLGKKDELRMGSMDALRDWGFAGDYVRAMWLMLQQRVPDDYVIATGKAQSVEDLVATAFEYVGLEWKRYVVIDEKFVRPSEEYVLVGDPTKAMKELGWTRDISFDQLIRMMIDADIKRHGG
ncbi:MAG: GDP-mannose 4,6-dehydratase [Chlorobia bacterium]|nr:GDP-mannose 4,6-dehydratase [Fimbriimonadaceae bacterium]